MKSKYIIIDPEDGVFLGTSKRHEVEHYIDVPPSASIVALFSGNNIFDLTKAAAFFDEKEASEYMHAYLKRQFSDAFVAEIVDDKDGPYVDVVDIIKAGYGEYTQDMWDALPMPSQADH